jgi:hypothetical protein
MRWNRSSGLSALALAAIACPAAAQQQSAQQQSVDVELVIAADISQSMDRDEHTLQRSGYIDAFRNQDVIAAMTSGPRKRIAVTYLEWDGETPPAQAIPWTIIDGEAAARSFAATLSALPLHGERNSSFATAFHEAARLIEGNDIASSRQVVNISGDGANAVGPPVTPARDELVRRGITINGLPIMLNKPREYYDIQQLDRYFEQCVIGGDGAFVAPLTQPGNVGAALRRALGPATPAQSSSDKMPMDCLIGEKAWAAGSR